MKKLLTILSVVLLVGCDARVETQIGDSIRYMKDQKTGLCFAKVGSRTKDGYVVASISEVPCEKVEKFLE